MPDNVQIYDESKVPALAPPRLPWHPMIRELYGIEQASWKALVEAVWPQAKTVESIMMALSYCKHRNLDPYKRVVHIVPVWDSDRKALVETVWPGIAELRTTAFRTRTYAGADACEFGPTIESEWRDGQETIRVKHPEWAQLTIYRMVDGERMPIPGPRVYWIETYSKKGRSNVPNERWQRAPFGQIEKCAEAAALRRGFPEELGDQHTDEEAGGWEPKDITPPRPRLTDEHPGLSARRAKREAAAAKPAEPERWTFFDSVGVEQEHDTVEDAVEAFAAEIGRVKAIKELDTLYENGTAFLDALRRAGANGAADDLVNLFNQRAGEIAGTGKGEGEPNGADQENQADLLQGGAVDANRGNAAPAETEPAATFTDPSAGPSSTGKGTQNVSTLSKGGTYDVVVPATENVQKWFAPAQAKLNEMRAQGRPPADFTRFREANSVMLRQLRDDFGNWAKSIAEAISAGEQGGRA